MAGTCSKAPACCRLSLWASRLEPPVVSRRTQPVHMASRNDSRQLGAPVYVCRACALRPGPRDRRPRVASSTYQVNEIARHPIYNIRTPWNPLGFLEAFGGLCVSIVCIVLAETGHLHCSSCGGLGHFSSSTAGLLTRLLLFHADCRILSLQL